MQQVWCKQLLKEKNITLAFVYTAKSETSLRLKLAASNEYQVFVNGKFLAYGPMRARTVIRIYGHIRSSPTKTAASRLRFSYAARRSILTTA